jgi:arylsulfatase A-like enzyme
MRSPNILLIVTDQQRADTLACYGNTFVQAPNLNRLASESVVIANAYCTQPVCTPSRASIFTGLWPHTHGCISNNIALRPDTKTVAEWIGDSYHCAYHGKWHLGDELRAQHGFEEWVSIEDGIYRKHYSDPADLARRSDYHHFLIENGFPPDATAKDGAKAFSRETSAVMGERFTKASFLGERAGRYLREYQQERPFFLTVSFLEPHPPHFGPLNHLYDPAEIPVGPAFAESPGDDAPAMLLRKVREFVAHGCRDFPARDASDWRRIRANYYGLVTLVDRAVGRILEALEASGHAEDTLIVFTSDHGEMGGDHALGKKDVMYEEAVRIPLLFRLPGKGREHRMVEGRMSLVDLAPTLLDFAGGETPGAMQGSSRRAVVEGRETLAGNDVFIDWDSLEEYVHRPWRSIISAEGWKLNLCRDDRGELYDLKTDPYERRSLYSESDQRDRIRELTDRLRRWQQETNDSASLPA